jgi:hypothetical protein
MELDQSQAVAVSDRIAAIERAVDAGTYAPGEWTRVVQAVRTLSIDDRCGLADDLSRVSRKLHQRSHRRLVSVRAGYAAEIAFALVGAIVLIFGVRNRSNLLVIAAALIWVTAFQPLVKVGVGYLLGVGYECAYLFAGVEPRFKMRFGEYLARPRYARLLLHLAGMIGSPIGAWLPTVFVPSGSLRIATYACWTIFWFVVAINAGSFVAMLTGWRSRVGPIRLADGSGGAAAIEVREALEL